MQEQNKSKKWWEVMLNSLAFLSFGSYTVACTYLFYMQAIQKIVDIEAGSHLFESDLPYHIKMAVVDGWYYSLTGFLYKIFDTFPASNYFIAVFLGLIAGGTVYLTYKMLEKIWVSFPKYTLMFFSLALNVMMAAHLDYGHTAWYIGYESGNLWHNSTYLVMRFFALITWIWYVRCNKHYQKKLSFFEGGVYAILLAITTLVKPSFIIVFLPTMAILLIIDLLKGASFKRVFFFALTVIPSLFVMIGQQIILFGESTESGIVVDPWYTLSLHANHPKVTLVLSIAFPLMVLAFSIRRVWTDMWYLGTWIMWGIGFLQILLLTETGTRANDGNFIWGYAIAIFILNIVSMIVFMEQWMKKKTYQGSVLLQRVYFLFAGFLFLYQTICGFRFFLWMLEGKTYWI